MTYPADLQTPMAGQDTPDAYHGVAGVGRRRVRTMSRPYQIAWLGQDGRRAYDTVIAPSVPVIESACASMARGALIQTADGPVAVEDLIPGTPVMTSEYGPLPVQWIGSYELSPREAQTLDRGTLYRVTTDAFGLAKPSQDLLLAPRAHILTRHSACRSLFGVEVAFAPVRAYEDGMSVFAVKPASPVSVYNISFDRQATIKVNGIEMESFHPGPHTETLLDDEMLYSLMRLFPQARNMGYFGPQLVQRLTTFEVQALREGAA